MIVSFLQRLVRGRPATAKLVPAFLFLLPLVTGRPAAAALPDDQIRALQRANRLVAGGSRAEGYAVLDSLVRVGEAHGDTTLRLAAMITKGGHLSWAGETREALRLLGDAVPAVEARGDSATFLRGVVWWADALLAAGRRDDARALIERTLPIAVRRADGEREGFLRKMLAYADLLEGRTERAIAGYRAAHRLLDAAGNRFGAMDALTGTARSLEALGRISEAEAAYGDVAQQAHAAAMPEIEADAWNNRGTSEMVRGDPATGLRAFQEAVRIRRSLGRPRDLVVPMTNAAWALAQLGRYDEAEASLDSLLSDLPTAECPAENAAALNELAEIRMGRGDIDGARRASRDVIALGNSVPVWYAARAYVGLASALAARDSVAASLALLDGPARLLRSRIPTNWGLLYDIEVSDLLLRAGEPGRARSLALAADDQARALQRPADRVILLTTAGQAELRLGERADALRDLREAAGLWEWSRRRSSEPEWREQATGGAPLCSALLRAILEGPEPEMVRVAVAFDAAQRFKARTLAERMPGGTADDSLSAVSNLATLQDSVLRAGELFLDAYVGEDASYLFAVNREGCRVVSLPGAAELEERCHLFSGLLLADPAGADPGITRRVRETAAESLGDLLLLPIADMMRTAGTILFSPDGPLYSLPLEAMRFSPGGDEGPVWIGTRWTVARVPSAAIWKRAREAGGRRNADIGRAGLRGLALSGRADLQGRSLAGAEEEVRDLTRRYRDVTTRVAISDSAAASAFASFDFIHFAAHTEFDDRRPWRSGVLLPADPRPAADSPLRILRADQFRGIRLAARLVVLSGCESAGGTLVAGEGVLGISSAFMATGVPTLVATLWPIDDHEAAVFMRRFYAALARGAAAGAALRDARRGTAAVPGAAPSGWAGFVLLGEPDLGISLRARSFFGRWGGAPAILIVAVAAIVLVFAGVRLRARARRRPPR